MDRVQGETELLGLASKIALFPGARQFGVTQSLRIVRAAVFDHRPEDACQLVVSVSPGQSTSARDLLLPIVSEAVQETVE